MMAKTIGVEAVCTPLANGESIPMMVAGLFEKGVTLDRALELLGQASLPAVVDERRKVLRVMDRDNGGQKTKVDISNLWLAKSHCTGQGPMGCWQGDCPITAGC